MNILRALVVGRRRTFYQADSEMKQNMYIISSRSHDGRWSTTMLDWQPAGGGRRAGHPKKRWRDDIEAVSAKLLNTNAQGEWRLAAENSQEWLRLEEECMREMGGGEERHQRKRP